ncbi:MAG TPA: hypothetical protein VLD39_09215 [Gammaproteobacteria bacterium]|nr:hypothetical protein [Gammaproteobacteria bacterium]
MQTPQDRGARWWIGAIYAVLLVLVIPWYWPVGDTRHVYGLPLWAIVTLSAVLVTSVFTAWVYLGRSEDGSDDGPQGQPRGRAESRDGL